MHEACTVYQALQSILEARYMDMEISAKMDGHEQR